MCSFLLYSKVNPLCVYLYLLFFGFSPIQVTTPRAGELPVLCSRFSPVILFTHGINSVCLSIPISQFIHHHPLPLGIHTFVLYVCVSISALQISSSKMLGKIEGKRRRGQQRVKWLDSITNSIDMNSPKFWEIVMYRGGPLHAHYMPVMDSLACCSPWGSQRVGHDLATEQEEEDRASLVTQW